MRKLLLILLMLFAYNIYSQKPVQLDTVVLKGIRADVKTPISQKTITSQDIQQIYSGQEIPVLLNSLPSMTSNTDGGHPQGYTYMRLRGMDQTRINMTLNGVPLNEPEDQGVYFSNYPNFAKNIKSLQIQRGVGTSSNGVSSYAGSINFVSKFGTTKSTELQAEYGAWNTKRLNFQHETGVSKNGRWSGFLNLSTFDTDGYKYHSGSDGFTGFLGVGYYGDFGTLKLTTFTGKSNNQMSWFAVSEEDIEKDPRTNYNSPDSDDNFDQSMIILEYKNKFNNKNSLSTSIFFNRLNGDWDLDVGDLLNFRLHSTFYGVVSNYNYQSKNYELNFGVSGNKYDRNHSMVILPNDEYDIYFNTGYKDELSSYLKGTVDIDNFTLFGDTQIRYTNFKYEGSVDLEKQEWTFFNPKLGLTYNLNKKTSFYTSVGKSQREPTRSDMFGGEDDLIEFVDVTPEEVVDYEMGVNYKSTQFTFQGNLYYMDFENEITLLGSLGSYSLQNFGNVDTSFRSGIELDAVWKPNYYLTIKYNGSFSNNKIKDNGIEFEPLYTPNVVNNFSVKLQPDNVFFEISGKTHSKSFLDFENENVTPPFVVFNVMLGYQERHFGFKLQILNFMNKEYFTNGYMDGGVRNFYVNAPTSIYGTLTYKF